MTIAEPPFARSEPSRTVPRLMPGDRLDQATFLLRYDAMPDGIRAELIEGIVYVPPTVGDGHSRPHGQANYWLFHYERHTPGVIAMNDGTTILGRRSMPQPDGALRIASGGQTRLNDRSLVVGCPELIVEVANTTEAIDLHAKRRDYDRHGAVEYVAVIVHTSRVAWFGRGPRGRLVEQPPDADGVHRSRAFPGLWLDPAALLAGDLNRLAAVLEQGLATPEHATFVARLARLQP